MKFLILVVFVALFLLAAPAVRCQTPPAPRPKLQLRDIEAMTPAARLRQAVAAGDLRFLGINSYGLYVPGVTGEVTNPLVELKGYYGIEGTSDTYEDDSEEERLQKIADRFARQYNRLLMAHLKAVNDADFQRAVGEIDEELRQLERANPQVDAKAALKKGNGPVIGVSGVGSPGLVKDKDFAARTSWRYLKANNDLMTPSQKIRLRKVVTRYVIPYNRAIQRHWNASRKKRQSNGRGNA